MADFLRFLLLTGLRISEATNLRWKDVDLRGRMFVARDTKNGTDHVLPMGDYLLAMFRRRSERSVHQPSAGAPFVFPGHDGAMSRPKAALRKVVRVSSVKFTPHSLRRTFATIAESLDVPFLALK